MIRKAIQSNATTLLVSLPKKWVNQYNVKKGDEINIEKKDGSLLITPTKQTKPKKKTAYLSIKSDYKQYIKLIITSTYRMGYDLVNIDFDTKKQFNTLQEVISERLIGYEITEKKQNRCKVESITEPPEDRIDVIVKRMFFIIKDTSDTILEFFKGGPNIDLKYLENQTYKIDQYSYFCRRTLSKKGYGERSYLKWVFSLYLLLIQHGYFRLIDYLIRKKIKPSKRFIELLGKTDKYFSNFLDAYFKKDIKEFSKINEIGENLIYKDCYRLFEQNTEGAAVYHLTEVIRHVYLSTVPSIGIFISYTSSEPLNETTLSKTTYSK